MKELKILSKMERGSRRGKRRGGAGRGRMEGEEWREGEGLIESEVETFGSIHGIHSDLWEVVPFILAPGLGKGSNSLESEKA